MKKALITGITGQDGSYLAELLLAKDYDVVGVYRRSSVPTFERVEHLRDNPRFRLVCGDVTDYSSINSILTKERPDEVYNLAAQSHVGVSFNQPLLTWDCTAVGCMNILESLRHLQSDSYKPRFYQASSSEMFGDRFTVYVADWMKSWECNHMTPEIIKDVQSGAAECYQDENTTMVPQSPYAVAKLAAHNMTTLYRKSYNMYTASGILFNHESPRRGENFVTRKITQYVAGLSRDIIHGQIGKDHKAVYPKLRLGNLDSRRDWGFAGDYVEAMWLMLQQEAGDDFVIATGKTYSIRDFLQYSFGYVGLNWQDFVVVDPQFVRPAEVPYLLGSADKAKRVLGWTPTVNCEQLAHMMVQADLDGRA